MGMSPWKDRIEQYKSMQDFGGDFIEALPRHIQNLRIPGRVISINTFSEPLPAQIDGITEIQMAMSHVLRHPITQIAQHDAESAFQALLQSEQSTPGVLRFFNGWNETHKTTSLVSAKLIMRLSADALSAPAKRQRAYHYVRAHLHEVAKDDFGLGHKGHDGMYCFITAAFDAQGWTDPNYRLTSCDEFSNFLYDVGVAKHKAALDSFEYKQSIMDAMMVSIASELWNGREYNFIAQHIEAKLVSMKPAMKSDPMLLRNAKGYVMGHAGEVENRHGLHALAAAQAVAKAADLKFSTRRLTELMLDYNDRVGRAFNALHTALTDGQFDQRYQVTPLLEI